MLVHIYLVRAWSTAAQAFRANGSADRKVDRVSRDRFAQLMGKSLRYRIFLSPFV
jgi:hypothetical protein